MGEQYLWHHNKSRLEPHRIAIAQPLFAIQRALMAYFFVGRWCFRDRLRRCSFGQCLCHGPDRRRTCGVCCGSSGWNNTAVTFVHRRATASASLKDLASPSTRIKPMNALLNADHSGVANSIFFDRPHIRSQPPPRTRTAGQIRHRRLWSIKADRAQFYHRCLQQAPNSSTTPQVRTAKGPGLQYLSIPVRAVDPRQCDDCRSSYRPLKRIPIDDAALYPSKHSLTPMRAAQTDREQQRRTKASSRPIPLPPFSSSPH